MLAPLVGRFSRVGDVVKNPSRAKGVTISRTRLQTYVQLFQGSTKPQMSLRFSKLSVI